MSEKENVDKPDSKEPAPEKKVLTQEEIEKLENQVAELEGLREKWLRSAAEFENAKKRLAREREEFVKFSQENLLYELLPVLDNFDRALGHQVDCSTLDKEALEKQLKSIVTGMQMVKKQIFDVLQGQGVKPIPAIGEIFDPHRHEVVDYVPGEGRPDEIIAEVQTGYLLHDRLLRASKVRVRGAAKNQAENA